MSTLEGEHERLPVSQLVTLNGKLRFIEDEKKKFPFLTEAGGQFTEFAPVLVSTFCLIWELGKRSLPLSFAIALV